MPHFGTPIRTLRSGRTPMRPLEPTSRVGGPFSTSGPDHKRRLPVEGKQACVQPRTQSATASRSGSRASWHTRSTARFHPLGLSLGSYCFTRRGSRTEWLQRKWNPNRSQPNRLSREGRYRARFPASKCAPDTADAHGLASLLEPSSRRVTSPTGQPAASPTATAAYAQHGSRHGSSERY